MLTCFDVSAYLLSLTDPDVGDIISNLKLQKLVYYCQGFSLALYDKPLFNESLEAWEHGPVVPELYHEYKQYGNNAISLPEDIDFSKYSQPEQELIKDVYRMYGQFSAWKLRNMAHEEPPYIKTPRNEIISHQLMKDFFSTLIEE